MKLYHITKKENKDSIIENGLRTNEGMIFLFKQDLMLVPDYSVLKEYNKDTNKGFVIPTRIIQVSDYIAFGQLGLEEYSIFEVDVNKSKLKKDDVGEFSAKYQYYIEENIPANKVRYIRDCKTKKISECPLFSPKKKCV